MYWAYHTLRLPYGASHDEVRRSYRELIKRYHPDKSHSANLSCGSKSSDLCASEEPCTSEGEDLPPAVMKERFLEVQRAYHWIVSQESSLPHSS